MAIVFAKPEVKIEGTEAVVNYEGNTFLEHTEVEEKIVKQVFKDFQEVNKATAEEGSNKAVEIFKDNSSVERVVLNFKTGIGAKDITSMVIDKEKEYHVPGTDKKVKNSAIAMKTLIPSLYVSKSYVKSRSKYIHETVCG